MREYEIKFCEKYSVVGVLLGTGTPMEIDFVPAEGTLAEAMMADQQRNVTHAQLTRDCKPSHRGEDKDAHSAEERERRRA